MFQFIYCKSLAILNRHPLKMLTSRVYSQVWTAIFIQVRAGCSVATGRGDRKRHRFGAGPKQSPAAQRSGEIEDEGETHPGTAHRDVWGILIWRRRRSRDQIGDLGGDGRLFHRRS